MWSLSYYNSIRKDLRAEEVFLKGDFIDHFETEDDITVSLYSFDTFYVEVYYQHDQISIDKIKGISIDEALKKYIAILNSF